MYVGTHTETLSSSPSPDLSGSLGFTLLACTSSACPRSSSSSRIFRRSHGDNNVRSVATGEPRSSRQIVTKMRTSLPSGWNALDLHLAALWVNTHNPWQGLAQTLSRRVAQQMQGVGGLTINIQNRCRSSSSIECRSTTVINQSSRPGHQNL